MFKGRNMRHDVLKVIAILLAVTSINNANCSPHLYRYDIADTSHNVISIPVGYLKSRYLESSPTISKHLDLYDKQDAENSIKASNITSFDINKYNGDISNITYDYRIKRTVPNHQFIEDIFIVSEEYNIDPLLLHAIAEIESAYNAKAVSKAGAQGLMQVMPDTARRFGMQNPNQELFNPISNLRVSSNYIRSLHKLFGNNIPLILAAYNAGENAVIKYGYNIPPYKETQNYVEKVMKRYLEMKEKSYQL